MRIAFDLDGVLADLHTPYVKTALSLFPDLDPRVLSGGATVSPPADANAPADEDAPQATSGPELSSRQADAVWRVLTGTNDFWETLDEIEPGAIQRLANLADERGWEMIFITSRPSSEGRTVQRQSQRWLESKGFPMPSVYVVHGSRGRVASALALDLFIDDRPDNCLDIVLESKAGALLLWRAETPAPASTRRLGIAVVPTVDRVLNAIVEAERAVDGDGFVDRLKRLFGLKAPTPQSVLR